jgi:hypothetical protein
MILLPLVENAIKHGPASGHRGVVRFAVGPSSHPERLVVTVENPGAYAGPRAGSEGLPTVERRLELAYGEEATLRIARAGDRTRVDVEEGSQNETTGSDRSVVGYAAIGALTQSYMRRESVDEEGYSVRGTGRAQGHDRRCGG